MTRPVVTPVQALKSHLPKDSRLLLAVSGGADSICLLDAAVRVRDELNLHLQVAHIDHGLRSSSADDAAFVTERAKAHSLPFHPHRLENGPGKENVEAWGRRERYRFFNEVCESEKLDWVVTAHTANDVTETFLMRLVRNKELNSILSVDFERRCLRPLLSVARNEIELYLREHSLPFREDPTNSDTNFLRNRVRHVLLPLLEKDFDPRMNEVVSNRARAVENDILSLYELADRAVSRVTDYAFGSKEWLGAVRKERVEMPDGVQWRFFERLAKDKLGFNLGRFHANELGRVLGGEISGVELPGGVRVSRSGGAVTFEKKV